MCWNYRGYGKSKSNCFGFINPYNSKLDAEKIVEFVVNKLKLKGKIGVYGRSLGGITSCHLANKFPNIVSALIVDRTFCDIDEISERRLYGVCTKTIFRFISFNWKALNDQNFSEAKCYKIVTSDPNDDVIDNYANLATGVAIKQAQHTYETKKWNLFFESLCMIYDIEQNLFNKLSEGDQTELNFRLIKSFEMSHSELT